LPQFSTPAAFDALWLWNGVKYRKCKTCIRSEYNRSSFRLRHFAHLPLIFTGSKKVRNLTYIDALRLSTVPKRSNAPDIWNKLGEQRWLLYVATKFGIVRSPISEKLERHSHPIKSGSGKCVESPSSRIGPRQKYIRDWNLGEAW